MRLLSTLTIMCVLGGISACDRQGPFERAGEEVDETFENLREGEPTLGNRLDDAVDDVRDAAEDASDELSR